MRMLLLATLLGSIPMMATAAPPKPPDYMSVFVCKVVEGHYDPGHPVIPSHDWLDKDWAVNEDGLKVCQRWYFTVDDEAAKKDPTILQMHPDLSKFFACAFIGASMPYKIEIDGEDWYSYKRGCPRPVFADSTTIEQVLYGEVGPIDYTEPSCPSDCLCINEPHDI